MQVKHFKDVELFCSVGAHEVFVETFWMLTPYLSSPSSLIYDVISKFIEAELAVIWRPINYLEKHRSVRKFDL